MFTKKQAAKKLGVSIRTLDRYRAAGIDLGEVTYKRNLRHVVRFKESKILKLVEKGFNAS